MTVAELVAKLKELPGEMQVVQPGNSDSNGLSDIYGVDVIEITPEQSWRGSYAIKDTYNKDKIFTPACFIG
jgi:hypothetical protein